MVIVKECCTVSLTLWTLVVVLELLIINLVCIIALAVVLCSETLYSTKLKSITITLTVYIKE